MSVKLMPATDGQCWVGIAHAYGEEFIAELWESEQNRGYFHYAYSCVADDFFDFSKKPVSEPYAMKFLKQSVRSHGLTIDDFEWHAVSFDKTIYAKRGGRR